jgi:hypothetical protein
VYQASTVLTESPGSMTKGTPAAIAEAGISLVTARVHQQFAVQLLCMRCARKRGEKCEENETLHGARFLQDAAAIRDAEQFAIAGIAGTTAAGFTPFAWVADFEQSPNTPTPAAIAFKRHSEGGILISLSREFVGIPSSRSAAARRTRHPRRSY